MIFFVFQTDKTVHRYERQERVSKIGLLRNDFFDHQNTLVSKRWLQANFRFAVPLIKITLYVFYCNKFRFHDRISE